MWLTNQKIQYATLLILYFMCAFKAFIHVVLDGLDTRLAALKCKFIKMSSPVFEARHKFTMVLF